MPLVIESWRKPAVLEKTRTLKSSCAFAPSNVSPKAKIVRATNLPVRLRIIRRPDRGDSIGANSDTIIFFYARIALAAIPESGETKSATQIVLATLIAGDKTLSVSESESQTSTDRWSGSAHS